MTGNSPEKGVYQNCGHILLRLSHNVLIQFDPLIYIYSLYDSTSLEILIVSDLTIGVYGKIISTGNLFSKGYPLLPPQLG